VAELYGIVADLDLCIGCYACEVACKQENNVPVGKQWLKVNSIGPVELKGRARIDFAPIMTEGCKLCQHRLDQNLEPRCVDNCPTQALRFCRNATELLAALQNGRRCQICKLGGEVPAYG